MKNYGSDYICLSTENLFLNLKNYNNKIIIKKCFIPRIGKFVISIKIKDETLEMEYFYVITNKSFNFT